MLANSYFVMDAERPRRCEKSMTFGCSWRQPFAAGHSELALLPRTVMPRRMWRAGQAWALVEPHKEMQ